MKLSLVVPCYNEAENVAPFQEAVIQAFQGCGYDFELVFINDGSRDATLHNLKKLYSAQKCPVKVVSFSRNFGKEAGIYAGLQYAEGSYIALIDADLQQRPEIVRDMVKILDEQPEYDVVAAYQDRRGEGKVLSFFKKSFYWMINKLSDVSLQPDASDFRTFRRSVRDSILELAEYDPGCFGKLHQDRYPVSYFWKGHPAWFLFVSMVPWSKSDGSRPSALDRTTRRRLHNQEGTTRPSSPCRCEMNLCWLRSHTQQEAYTLYRRRSSRNISLLSILSFQTARSSRWASPHILSAERCI